MKTAANPSITRSVKSISFDPESVFGFSGKPAARGDREIPAIQALRAFAALSIAMLHILGEAGAMSGTPGRSPWPKLADFPWESGVDLFFVISGFVMVYSSREVFNTRSAGWLFLRRRVARILPIYWAVTSFFLIAALVAPVALNDPFGSWQVVVASYLFVPWQRLDGSFLPVFRLGWTLNYEMLFYVVFAVAVRYPLRRAVSVVSATLLALVLTRNFEVLNISQFRFWGDPIVIEFVYGMAVGLLVMEGGRIPKFGLLLGVLGLAALFANPFAPDLPRWISFGLPATALLLSCLAPMKPSWILTALSRVGSASYAIYLIHLFVARAAREVWMRLLGPHLLGFYVGAALLGTIALSIPVHDLFEVPATRLVRRVFGVSRRSRPQ
jgi:exopolysaccharide production protein ExoZ